VLAITNPHEASASLLAFANGEGHRLVADHLAHTAIAIQDGQGWSIRDCSQGGARIDAARHQPVQIARQLDYTVGMGASQVGVYQAIGGYASASLRHTRLFHHPGAIGRQATGLNCNCNILPTMVRHRSPPTHLLHKQGRSMNAPVVYD
jgi:hypothetical protein